MQQIIVAGDFLLNLKTRKAYFNNRLLDLRNKEFELLKFFIINYKRALSRSAILEEVWDKDLFCATNTIDVHISSLRKLFKAREQKLPIKTINGFGYVLE